MNKQIYSLNQIVAIKKKQKKTRFLFSKTQLKTALCIVGRTERLYMLFALTEQRCIGRREAVRCAPLDVLSGEVLHALHEQ